jgi:hypothetical protein
MLTSHQSAGAGAADVATTGTDRPQRAGGNYSEVEDLIIAQAYLSVSEGNYQEGSVMAHGSSCCAVVGVPL